MSMGSKKTILKRTTAYVLAFVMAFSLLFTGNNAVTASAASAVTKITVKKKSVTIEPKKTVNVGVTVKGGNKKFTAKSSNKKIATVKVVGKKVRITAKKKIGKATITVTTKGKNKKGKSLKAKIKVNVANPTTEATTQATTEQATTQGPKPEDKYNNVKITTPTTTDGSAPSVNVGTSTKLTASVDAQDASLVKWSVSDSKVAVISEDGTVTGISAGTVEAIATMNGKEIGKITITISSVAVTGVTLDRQSLTLTENNTATLTATVAPETATVRTVKWYSSDDSVATVSSTGVVRAIKAGTAVITVSTTDKNFTANCKVTVTADSKDNVNGLKLKVTNALDGYDNTVLVGTNARISATVLKDGAPVREEIKVELIGVTGYTDYYVTSLDGDEGFTKTDAEDGTATFTVALNTENSDKKPIISSLDRNSYGERAFASFRVKVTASGSSYVEEIPLAFAQVLAETDQSPAAIAVDNLHDPDLKPLEGTYSPITANETVGYTTDKKNGYTQEYVVDQQVSSSTKDHTVYLDAAPMIILPATAGKEEGSDYAQTINYSVSEYSVYANEDDAYTLRGVPAGLQYLTMYFDSLKLSDHTRIVVRAYKADTNEPLTKNGKLIQDTIDKDTKLTSGVGGNTVQVAQEIFKQTAGEKSIDLKIFVESAGQVNENDNVGFKIIKVVGKWENQEMKPYDLERISSAVTWTIDNTQYTASTTLNNAATLLGDAYTSNNTYTVSLPSFPSVGDAVITEWQGDTENVVNCYLYPTIANEYGNSVTNKNELIPSGNDYYTFKGESTSADALSINKVTDELNRLKVDSKKVGHVQVKASINFGPDGEKGVHYDVYSAVQFSHIPKNTVQTPTEFYAMAGQKITIKLEYTDEDGVNPAQDVSPEWKGLEDLSSLGIHVDKKDEKTNKDGVAYLELTAAKGSVVKNISCKSDQYNIKMSVAGNVVSNNLVSLNWVRAGVYYKDSVTGDEYDTSRTKAAKLTASASDYKVTDQWIVGTQVCGVVGLDENDDDEISSDEVVKDIAEIKNILIDMNASSDDQEINTRLTPVRNGVCKWANEKTGLATLTAKVNGIEENKQPVFVFEDGTKATGVGEGDITQFAYLEVPVNWVVSGMNLTLINNNAFYNYNNTVKPRVYFQVLDDKNNTVPSTELIYSVSNGRDTIVDATEINVINGLSYVELDCPNTAVTYTVSAYIKNSGVTAAKTTTIQFKNISDAFVLNKPNNKPITEDLNAKTITFTFSQKVDPELVNLITKDFFKVTKQDGTTKVTVTDVTVDSSNRQKVTLTLSDIETGMHLAINPTITVDGIQYQLIDENGTYFTNTNPVYYN